jgi:RNA 3'-terminal phosphate cyclase (ATP)
VIKVDGSFGEGGGQIIRTSLGLSLVTGNPFRIEKIRANRRKPGLQRQHLVAVQAAVEIGQAEVEGNTLGSKELTFKPTTINSGDYRFSIGTAGSASLVLQTVLPALIKTSQPTKLFIEGGTHNPFAPPFEFLQKAFLPLLAKMGVKVESHLIRHGFYPAGGGQVSFSIESKEHLKPIHLNKHGKVVSQKATAVAANLPEHIAERELNLIRRLLNLDKKALETEIANSTGQGNYVAIEVESENATEVFTQLGERGKPAEEVARDAVRDAKNFLKSDAVIGEYLADQLLIPMALAKGGSFTMHTLSSHAITNIEIIKQFLDVPIKKFQLSEKLLRVEIGD